MESGDLETREGRGDKADPRLFMSFKCHLMGEAQYEHGGAQH